MADNKKTAKKLFNAVVVLAMTAPYTACSSDPKPGDDSGTNTDTGTGGKDSGGGTDTGVGQDTGTPGTDAGKDAFGGWSPCG